jgi:hypothetical protein
VVATRAHIRNAENGRAIEACSPCLSSSLRGRCRDAHMS